MARIRHLSRAPIAEAVIDFRVQSREGFAADSFLPVAERLKTRYPLTQPIESLAATFGFQEGKPTPADTTFSRLGLFLKTQDEQSIAQFRTDGFTFSRLPQYTSWEEVLPEALTLWRAYREASKPSKVTRLAVRYINRLRFALPSDLSMYVTAPPGIPESLPQQLRSYLTRLILSDVENGNSVIVTQATEPSSDPDHIVVLLDVDAYRDVGDMDPNNDHRIEDILGSLRMLKNRVFFGSITERTVEMYE